MAAENRTITFVNGRAENVSLPIGTYTFVSCSIPGYTDATATGFTIARDTQTVTIELTANGTLQVQVVDDLGSDVTAGSLQLSNADGTETYGTAAEIGTEGTASFSNVPYDTAAPVNVWLSQPASDDDHDPIETPQNVQMDANPTNAEVINLRKSIAVTATAADAVYPGITAINGDIVFNG